MKELIARFRRPLNQFWSRTRAVLLALSAMLIAVGEFVQPLLQDQFIPEEIHQYLRYAYIAGLFGAALASLTVDDTPAEPVEKIG